MGEIVPLTEPFPLTYERPNIQQTSGTLVHRAGNGILMVGSVLNGKGGHVAQSPPHILGNLFVALVFSPTFQESEEHSSLKA